MFPVLGHADWNRFKARQWPRFPDCPPAIPWDVLEPHEPQALRNHSQTLKRLAERGGLCPLEISAVMHDIDYPYLVLSKEERDIATLQAVMFLNFLLGC